MTNMWPYLRQRETELFMRMQIYRESFLNQALKGHDRISVRLWTSPDNAKQITVAIRFLLTQLYFSVSITNETHDQFKSKIVDAQEIILGELWSITVSSTKSMEVYYVLEATCEVVGRSSLRASTQPEDSPPGLLPIRADWSAYINAQSSLSSPINVSLMSHLKWTNHEEYDRGLSRVWLKRAQGEGVLGEIKRVVAERYVLACVVANSVSGPWMTSLDMAQAFNGMAPCLPEITQSMRVQLFLPAHHHVESLHFTTCKGEPLHPALAAVQTPAREYYIFRDNGMQVGCEEDGVARVWMQILGCDARGRLSCT
ncbi:hypothetical protein BDZ94DRAFT_1245823 [Collybia nuda]|uniref:Uncharacterized protein n=1 Tax=Collybia nuda TaxID=64659 RepID=A0A9P6CJL4_9AGAR|nr:hypothetical protein BDZ94DRAFT_1245823 [Collybia nuda]